MKKIFFILTAMVIVFLVAGCTNFVEDTQINNPKKNVQMGERIIKNIEDDAGKEKDVAEKPADVETEQPLPYNTEKECKKFWEELVASDGEVSVKKGMVLVKFSQGTGMQKAMEILSGLGYNAKVYMLPESSIFAQKNEEDSYKNWRQFVIDVPDGKEIETACSIKIEQPITRVTPEIIFDLF